MYETADTEIKVGFGKYKALTPVEILELDPAYICWAHKNTQQWVGSMSLIKIAHREAEIDLIDKPIQKLDNPTAEDFEDAVLNIYGQFPKPIWMK